jgi:membrane protease YdiL (CAAX protease family)
MAYSPSTPWSATKALIAVIATGLGVPLVIGFCVGFYGGLTHQPTLYMHPLAAVLMAMATQVAWLGLVLWMGRARGGNLVDVLKLGPPVGGVFAYVVMPLVLVILARLGLGVMLQLFGAPHPQQIVGASAHLPWILSFLLLVVLAPVAEEMLFRGFLLSALAQTRIGFWGAAAVSGLLWTLMHLDAGTLVMAWIFLFGMVISYALWRTGSLRVCMIIHALNNLIVFIAMQALVAH